MTRNANPATWNYLGQMPDRSHELIVDVLAKHWDPDTDKFEYRRFTDCQHKRNYQADLHKTEHWRGVPDGWHVVGWMYPPGLTFSPSVSVEAIVPPTPVPPLSEFAAASAAEPVDPDYDPEPNIQF